MRQIGSLDSKQHADRFSDFLATKGVAAQVEESQGNWCIWVRDENQLEESRKRLALFRQGPDAEEYVSASAAAGQLRLEEKRQQEKAARNKINIREHWNAPMIRRAPLTAALIAICVVVGMFSGSVFAPHQPAKFTANRLFRALALYDPAHRVDPDWNRSPFVDIERGQVWRLFSPALLHLGFMHVIFNMLVLRFFGSRIESRQGWVRIAILFLAGSSAYVVGQLFASLVLGIGSYGVIYSLFDFLGALSSAPVVGFSGVGYAMFGYLWAYGMIAPEKRLGLETQNIVLFLGWLVAGYAGILDRLFGISVGNWAHLTGLVAGFAVAIISIWYERRPNKDAKSSAS